MKFKEFFELCESDDSDLALKKMKEIQFAIDQNIGLYLIKWMSGFKPKVKISELKRNFGYTIEIKPQDEISSDELYFKNIDFKRICKYIEDSFSTIDSCRLTTKGDDTFIITILFNLFDKKLDFKDKLKDILENDFVLTNKSKTLFKKVIY